MTKQDLSRRLALATGIDLNDAHAIVSSLVSILADAVGNGERVALSRFATISPVTRKPRRARNIPAGCTINVPARRTARIKICAELRRRLNASEDVNE